MASSDGHAGGARKRLRTEAAGPPQQPMEGEAAVAAAVARLAHLGCVFDEDGVLRCAGAVSRFLSTQRGTNLRTAPFVLYVASQERPGQCVGEAQI